MSSIVGFAVVFVAAWGVALTAVAVARAGDALEPRVDALHFAVIAAMYEAHARGHERMTHVHLVLALSFDPDVAARVARIGSVDDLRERLDAHLRAHHDGEDDVAWVPTPDARGETILGFVRDLRGGEASRTPESYLSELVGMIASNPAASRDVHAIFEAFGLTADAWRRSAEPEATDVASPASGLPYRTRASTRGDYRVRFWNDDQTTQELVVGLLTRTFARTPIEARHLMLRTHFLGSAAFGDYLRDEAEDLVRVTLTVVRDAGFPLRITVERRGREPASGFWARLLR